MKETLPRVLLDKEGDSALCLKASGSNSFAGVYRANKADDHWAAWQAPLTADRARFHRALCGQNHMKNSFHLCFWKRQPIKRPFNWRGLRDGGRRREDSVVQFGR